MLYPIYALLWIMQFDIFMILCYYVDSHLLGEEPGIWRICILTSPDAVVIGHESTFVYYLALLFTPFVFFISCFFLLRSELGAHPHTPECALWLSAAPKAVNMEDIWKDTPWHLWHSHSWFPFSIIALARFLCAL